MAKDNFSSRLLEWFDLHGRHSLPWQIKKDLYRVWVSAIMLQQTQVKTVIPNYQRFMQRFGDIQSLANASIDEVLAHWAGLGYYARGRNLQKAAKIVMAEHHGRFPEEIEAVNALPGIGRSTAGAILSLALKQRHAILDGNVKRSLCRYHGIKAYPGTKPVETQLWQLAEQHTPHQRNDDYTQAIMDFGAMLCTRSKPQCSACPLQNDCLAFQNDWVTAIPKPRPKKIKPRKHRTMLVLLDEHQRLSLFKRPSSGIWGGLYSLPEFADKNACIAALKACDDKAAQNTRIGAIIQHSFTHFDLTITPVFCDASNAQRDSIIRQLSHQPELGILPHEQQLYSILVTQNQQSIGLPAPIQKIIHQLVQAR